MPAMPAKLTADSNDLRRSDSIPLPNRLLRVGKYLLPWGMKYTERQWTRAPREQASITQLAADDASGVSLRTFGSAETLPEYEYDCYSAGGRESQSLRSAFFPPSFVAELRNGLSFGRHCCVIA